MARRARRRKMGFSTKTTFDWSPAKFLVIGGVIMFIVGYFVGAGNCLC